VTRPALILALAVLLSSSGALIDGAAAQFRDETTVVVVEVPVHVLRDGEPMRDLTADDFEILDGRKKQEIVGFEMIDLGEFGTAPEQRRVTEIPATGRRHFLLLFDLSLSDPESIIRARKSARRLIWEGLHPADLVAVATYSEYNGVRMVLNFTPNREQVEVAIKTLGLAEPAARIHDPLSLLLGDLAAEGEGDTGGGGGQIPDVIAETARDLKTMTGRVTRDQQKNRVMALTSNMSQLAQTMNGIDGRKSVVFLSEGFDSEILTGIEDIERQAEIQRELAQGNVWQSDATERFGDTQAASAIESMVEQFRRADCAIQTVNIGGVEAGPDADTKSTRNEGLFRMARETGGEFYQNYNEIDRAMVAVLNRTSVTYILAFQPEDLQLDGKFHRLRVRLKDQPRGVTLVHRPGYYPPKPFAQQSAVERQLTTASEILAGSTGGSFQTAVLSAAFPAPDGGLFYAPVLIEVDGPGLLVGHQGETLMIELYAYALDLEGRVVDFFVRKLGLDVARSSQALMSSGFKYGGHLDLGPGEYLLRTMVRNGVSGDSSLSETTVTVPDTSAGQSVLLPPLFPETPGKWLFGRESQEEQRTDVDYPFVLGEELFMPAARPVLGEGAIAIGIPGYNLGAGSLALSAQLFQVDGTAVNGASLELLDRRATSALGFEWLVATFDAGQPVSGDYLLTVTVTDLASGEQLSSSTTVTVG
jgi:VWFA-related protein